MQEEELKQKQQFLRAEIIGKEVDPQEFMQFMGSIKNEGDNIDLDHWTMAELKGVVDRYRQYISKSKQELLSSRISREVRMTKIHDSGKKEKFKYQGTSLWDFQQNYQQECSKSELAFEFPQNAKPKIQIEKWDLKSVGGFLFGIGSRNELQLTISSNFTPNKVIRKAEDCDWLKAILTLRHSGSFVPPLEPSREFASDDKKGINTRISEISYFLNTLLDYPVFRYSSYFKQFLVQQNYKKFHEYKNRESQFAKEKDILEIESPSGHFNVQISDKLNQGMKRSSQITHDLNNLYGQLGSCMKNLLNDLDTVSRSIKILNEVTAKIEQKYKEIQNYFNYKEIKLPTILLALNGTSSIILKNVRLHTKALYEFSESFIKTSTKDWNEFLVFDRRHSNEFKSYLSAKENLIRRKEKYLSDPLKWELPEVDLQKIQKQGVGKLTKQQAFEKMFPNDNERENQTRIWMSFVNQNYFSSFKQFLLCQQKSLFDSYLPYSQKYLSFSSEVRRSYESFREIIGL